MTDAEFEAELAYIEKRAAEVGGFTELIMLDHNMTREEVEASYERSTQLFYKKRSAKMFNDVCWELNNAGQADKVARLRQVVAMALGTERHDYETPEKVGGWAGWLETPLGTVAFVTADGETVWKW
jgi:glucose-6-phosphate 1-dehydrogenase